MGDFVISGFIIMIIGANIIGTFVLSSDKRGVRWGIMIGGGYGQQAELEQAGADLILPHAGYLPALFGME